MPRRKPNKQIKQKQTQRQSVVVNLTIPKAAKRRRPRGAGATAAQSKQGSNYISVQPSLGVSVPAYPNPVTQMYSAAPPPTPLETMTGVTAPVAAPVRPTPIRPTTTPNPILDAPVASPLTPINNFRPIAESPIRSASTLSARNLTMDKSDLESVISRPASANVVLPAAQDVVLQSPGQSNILSQLLIPEYDALQAPA